MFLRWRIYYCETNSTSGSLVIYWQQCYSAYWPIRCKLYVSHCYAIRDVNTSSNKSKIVTHLNIYLSMKAKMSEIMLCVIFDTREITCFVETKYVTKYWSFYFFIFIHSLANSEFHFEKIVK